jgi:hypothetical protein
MIIINNVIVSEEVIGEDFSCNLNACKGACCWEGDYGAPLTNEEAVTLEEIQNDLLDYIGEENRKLIQEEGGIKFYEDKKILGTNLQENGACVYLNTEGPISYCGIEKAWKDKVVDFRKPISCHLYPIRIEEDHTTGFETLNYDRWNICSAACVKGKKLNIKIFKFAKDALIRKYGEEFYSQLEDSVEKYLE